MTKRIVFLAALIAVVVVGCGSGVSQDIVDRHMEASDRLLKANQVLRDSTAWFVVACDSMRGECEAKFWECADINSLLIDEVRRHKQRISRLVADSARCNCRCADSTGAGR